MGSSTAPASLESRVDAILVQLGQHAEAIKTIASSLGTQTKGKLSTRTVGLLSAVVTVVGAVVSSSILPTEAAVGLGAIAGGITAYLAAEET